ncbi:keratin-associated protein 21-2-like [Hyaena hyaena]|uniref:keratin-associated protein 21-2-like n=1 Tax=Hyaena hyaena TaxID=95912 RepID=UPI001922B83A|nr:keratin-associated protein 21-2-like [Hyaena hyaena]
MCGSYYGNYYGGCRYGGCGYGGCGYGSCYGCGFRRLGCGSGCGYGYRSHSLYGCGSGCGFGCGYYGTTASWDKLTPATAWRDCPSEDYCGSEPKESLKCGLSNTAALQINFWKEAMPGGQIAGTQTGGRWGADGNGG